MSGIAETVCVIVSSSAVGRWVDSAPTRLRPLLVTIFTNRTTLVACCILWILLFSTTDESAKRVMFAVILALGMVEKSSRMANILSMERDWVPTIASTDGDGYTLTHMNTVMRRIDIACKFLAPLAISGTVMLLDPVPAAAAMASVSSMSLVLEAWSAMKVWKTNSRLRTTRREKQQITSADPARKPKLPTSSPHVGILRRLCAKSKAALSPACAIIRDHVEGLNYYFSTTVWLPSTCVAILHASVLAWSGTLITWLLNANFSLTEITVAKGVGSFFEIGSTLVFPWAVSMFSMPISGATATASYQMIERHSLDDEDEIDHYHTQMSPKELQGEVAPDSQLIGSRSLHIGVVKVAQRAITSLLVCLIPTLLVLFYLNSRLSDEHPNSASTAKSPLATHTTSAILFFTFLSFSFLGRWTYDLAATQLTQMLIPATHRSSFGGVEQAMVSSVSLMHWIAAAIWHRQGDFVWLALGSLCAIAAATGALTWWARRWTMNETQ